MSAADRRFRVGDGRLVERRQRPAVDRRTDDQVRALEAPGVDAERLEDAAGFAGELGIGDGNGHGRFSTVWRRRGA